MSYGTTSTAPTVLVTSSTSFLGAHTVLELVRRGYLVKAGVPSVALARQFLKKHPECASALEWAVIPSLTDLRAVEEAVRDVDYVIHVCAPFAQEYDDQMDVVLPAVDGTHALLAAAAHQSRVRQVVLTSSFGAVIDPTHGLAPGHTYTPSSWNPANWETALTATDPIELHLATKTLTERSAWEFVSSFQPSFSLTTFCPPVVLGPPAQPLPDLSINTLGEAVSQAWALLSGQFRKQLPETRYPLFVDVRDLARMTVSALGNAEARNQRFLAVGGEFSNSQIAGAVRKHFPSEASRLPRTKPTAPRPHAKADISATERVFGKQWTPLEKTVKDMAEVLYTRDREMGRSGGKGRWNAKAMQERLEITHERVISVQVA